MTCFNDILKTKKRDKSYAKGVSKKHLKKEPLIRISVFIVVYFSESFIVVDVP